MPGLSALRETAALLLIPELVVITALLTESAW
jgi:hypothetical protein